MPDFYGFSSGQQPTRLSTAVSAAMDEFTWPSYSRDDRPASAEPLPAPTESSTLPPVSLERKRPATEEPDDEQAKRQKDDK